MPRRLFITGYDPEAPSFRTRVRSLLPALREAGWTIDEDRFPQGRYGLRTWQRRRRLAAGDVVLLAKIKLSAPEAWLFGRFARRVVFDLDDAIYLRKPRRIGEPPGDARARRAKFEATCRLAAVVAAGNEVLAAAARPFARRTVVLPTPIDVSGYRPSAPDPSRPPVVVWIGRPENLVYLDLVRPALARLAARVPGLALRVVCSRFPEWDDVPLERVHWSAETEAAALATADVGIMPLADDGWTRAKCAFKLLQYMAAALPCVASPVGANREAVLDGVTGYLAPDSNAWEDALSRLVAAPELRVRLGAAGRRHVEARYGLPAYARAYAALLAELAAGSGDASPR